MDKVDLREPQALLVHLVPQAVQAKQASQVHVAMRDQGDHLD